MGKYAYVIQQIIILSVFICSFQRISKVAAKKTKKETCQRLGGELFTPGTNWKIWSSPLKCNFFLFYLYKFGLFNSTRWSCWLRLLYWMNFTLLFFRLHTCDLMFVCYSSKRLGINMWDMLVEMLLNWVLSLCFANTLLKRRWKICIFQLLKFITAFCTQRVECTCDKLPLVVSLITYIAWLSGDLA